ncbi:MAG: hypothetical protein EOO20_17555 [Chryseobacterium sp.]|nr:MAG: hypothetical protein EOO20_17555 [Chryseobacterium sp.]
MSSQIKWFFDNIFNFISVAGFIATLYFGLYYIPSWFKDAQKQRFANVEGRTEMTIKELIYSDSTCRYEEIAAMIKANEAEIEQDYPITIDQVLANVQSSFLEDKFLPLERRIAFFNEIQLIRDTAPEPAQKAVLGKGTNFYLSLLSIVLTVLITLTGLYSYYLKFKKEKASDEEIANQSISVECDFVATNTGLRYEQQLTEVIRNFSGVKVFESLDHQRDRFDLEFVYDQRNYLVEFKYLTKSKIGLSSLEGFIHAIKGLQGEFWFIYNTDLTTMVKNRIEQYSKISGPNRRIRAIKIETPEELNAKLNDLLNN